MGVSEYYREQKSQHGTKTAIKKTLQYGFRKIAGTDQYEVQLAKQQEELNTLHYFLNNYADITKAKPATGTLRNLQLCDATFLAIVDKILQRNNLQYWMSWGTLLGAVRHKGFIPWDDDLDISMPRNDFEKALDKITNNNIKFDIVFLDPPYKTDFIFKAIELIIDKDILNKDGLIVAETDELERVQNEITKLDVNVFDIRRYGRVYLMFIKLDR